MDDKDRQIQQLEVEKQRLEATLTNERGKLGSLQKDRTSRSQEAWARFALASALTLLSVTFLWCLASRVLCGSGIAEEVLATVFGIAALWTIMVVAVFRWLGTHR